MTTYPKIYLGLDNCVASKRWCEPAHWMNLCEKCGVYYVEASADNEIDPLYTTADYLDDWAAAVLADANKTGVKVANLYSGHGTYATLGLAHPDERVRNRIHHDWLDRMVDLAAKMNAGLGFFCHAFDQATLNDPARYAFAYNDLTERLAALAAYAAEKKLDSIGVEQMYTPHQVPWTVANAGQLLKDCYAKNGKDFYLTIDTGHQSGQRKFAAKDDAATIAAFNSIREKGRAEGIYLGSAAAERAIVAGALNGVSDSALLDIVKEDRNANPWLWSEDADGDTYRWLEQLGTWSPIVHLQQTDGKSSAHQPFSEKCNATGIIRGEKVLQAIKAAYDKPVAAGMPAPCKGIVLTLEVFAGTADLTCDIENKIIDSVRYWRQFIPEDGMTLDQLV